MNICTFMTRQVVRRPVKIISLLFLSLLMTTHLASPGAHGPNGEHLDEGNTHEIELNPRFETFTESFELVGELVGEQLFIYLHDYKTNVPVLNADVEIETLGQSVKAVFDEAAGHYRIDNESILNGLNQPGDYELTFTILTETDGDLMSADFHNDEMNHEASHDDHHHHFPWGWIAGIFSALFIGFVGGRFFKGGVK